MRENWDDLRFVLAVAEEGSVNGAARRLGVNHATVLRRIAAYEDAVEMPVFDKTARGYAVSGPLKQVIDATREVERAVHSVGRMLQGARAPLTGEVRITSTDSFCNAILPDILTRLRVSEPELRLELFNTNQHLDLARTHADVAIRPAESPPDGLVGEAVARFTFGLYRAAGHRGDDWLGMAGQLRNTVPGRWLGAQTTIAPVIAADSFLTLKELVLHGQGRAILPDYLAKDDARLEYIPGLIPEMAVNIWVLSHADLADIPRFARVRAALGRELGALAPRLVRT